MDTNRFGGQGADFEVDISCLTLGRGVVPHGAQRPISSGVEARPSRSLARRAAPLLTPEWLSALSYALLVAALVVKAMVAG